MMKMDSHNHEPHPRSILSVTLLRAQAGLFCHVKYLMYNLSESNPILTARQIFFKMLFFLFDHRTYLSPFLPKLGYCK